MIEIPEKCDIVFRSPTDWIHPTKFGVMISTNLWHCSITDCSVLFDSGGGPSKWYFAAWGQTPEIAFNQAMQKMKQQKELYKPKDKPKIGLSLFRRL